MWGDYSISTDQLCSEKELLAGILGLIPALEGFWVPSNRIWIFLCEREHMCIFFWEEGLWFSSDFWQGVESGVEGTWFHSLVPSSFTSWAGGVIWTLSSSTIGWNNSISFRGCSKNQKWENVGKLWGLQTIDYYTNAWDDHVVPPHFPPPIFPSPQPG